MQSGSVHDEVLPESITEELGLQHIHLGAVGRIVAWNEVAGSIKTVWFLVAAADLDGRGQPGR